MKKFISNQISFLIESDNPEKPISYTLNNAVDEVDVAQAQQFAQALVSLAPKGHALVSIIETKQSELIANA